MSKLGFSTFNSTQICHNALNLSPSKLQYSFQKSPRFSRIGANCPQHTYQLPDPRNKRTTSFGYGTKSDFTKTTAISPAPVLYEKKSDFDKMRSTQKGKSFGTARHQMTEYGHIVPGPIKNPGVGNYNLNRDLNKISYTLRSRTPELHIPVFLNGKRTYQQAPGPGTYEMQPAITKNGKQFFAKYQTSGLAIIHPKQSKRFQNDTPYAPGPNHYMTEQSQGTGIHKNARYVLSQHRGTGTRAFSLDKRISFTERIANNNIAPGVGSYRQPSEFGIYEGTTDQLNTGTSFHKKNSKQ